MIPAWVDASTTLKWNASSCQTVGVALQQERENEGEVIVSCVVVVGLGCTDWCFVLLTLLLLVVSAVEGEEEVGHRVVVV